MIGETYFTVFTAAGWRTDYNDNYDEFTPAPATTSRAQGHSDIMNQGANSDAVSWLLLLSLVTTCDCRWPELPLTGDYI